MHTLSTADTDVIQALMGLFGTTRALERLEDRIAKQEALSDDLAREVRGLKLEYVELYDKVRHQMSRMAKRAAVADQEAPEEPLVVEPEDGVDPISRNILALRGAPRRIA